MGALGKNKFKLLIVGMLVAAGSIIGFSTMSTSAVEASTAGCSDNSVIKCGVKSISDLRSKYNSNYTSGTKTIYTYMGVTSDMVNKANYKTGTINKDGTIVVGGKVVAKNAQTAGRFSTPGATYHKINGVTFYSGTTQVRFITYTSTPVFVFYDDYGRVTGAVMLDCGNPVKVVNVVPTPSYACNALNAVVVDRTTRKFTTTATAKNGATVSSYMYEFGDGKTKTVNSSSTTNTVSYTYAKEGTYNVSAKVSFKVGYVVKSKTCTTKVTISKAPQPGIELTKFVNGKKSLQVNVNQQFTYTVTVKNTGKVNMTNVVVTDTPPAGVTLLSADKGTVSGNAWTYTIPSLKIGESMSFNLTAKVDSYVSGTLTNTACVNAPEVNPKNPSEQDACDTADVTVTPPSTPPQVLPDTGAGSVIGIFAAVTITGALLYRAVLSRKISE